MAEGGEAFISLTCLLPCLDMQKSLCLCAAFSRVFCGLNAACAPWDSHWSVGHAAIDWVWLRFHVSKKA